MMACCFVQSNEIFRINRQMKKIRNNYVFCLDEHHCSQRDDDSSSDRVARLEDFFRDLEMFALQKVGISQNFRIADDFFFDGSRNFRSTDKEIRVIHLKSKFLTEYVLRWQRWSRMKVVILCYFDDVAPPNRTVSR